MGTPSYLPASLGRKSIINYTIDEATNAVIGYAFGTDLAGNAYGPNVAYSYAWHSFDVMLNTADDTVVPEDVLASTGLNSGITSEVMLRIIALLECTSGLPDLGQVADFWALDPGALSKDPGAGAPEHELWAWHRMLTSLSEVGGAVASKIVHHRHPTVMPLWDSKIGMAYNPGDTWLEIHNDLTVNASFFSELERRFEVFRQNHRGGDGVETKRLRLLDILVWGAMAGKRTHMEAVGKAQLAGLPPL